MRLRYKSRGPMSKLGGRRLKREMLATPQHNYIDNRENHKCNAYERRTNNNEVCRIPMPLTFQSYTTNTRFIAPTQHSTKLEP